LLYICLVLLLPLHAFAQSTVTWTPVGPSGSLDRIVALAVNPVNDSIVYAAAPGGGIWKSQDAGATWSPVFETQSSLQVCSLAIDPLLPDVVYAGTGDGQSPRDTQGVARSTDGGQTWTAQARMTTRPVCALAIDPTNTSRIFAGSAEGLFISSDSGATWAKVLSSAATSVAFGAPGIVYAGVLGDTSSGAPPYSLSRSSDGGRTWTSLAFPLASTSAPTANNWVSVLATNNTVFAAISYQTGAGSQLDFYSSSDGGNLWVPTFGVGQASPPVALVMDAGGNLYLGGKTLLTSSDSGSTWTVIPTRTTNFHAAGFTGGALLLAGEKGFELTGSSRVLSEPPVAQIVGVGMDPAGHIWTGGTLQPEFFFRYRRSTRNWRCRQSRCSSHQHIDAHLCRWTGSDLRIDRRWRHLLFTGSHTFDRTAGTLSTARCRSRDYVFRLCRRASCLPHDRQRCELDAIGDR
jgi:photosystem II stability/assembly factor-like uncharacterized protein